MRTYSQAMALPGFNERFEFLKLHGHVGFDTFGYDRYLNQNFYKSTEWTRVRNFVITRDNGCDLGDPTRPIMGRIYIHHIEPLTEEDFINGSDKLLDPENLICVSQDTHNALHYGGRPQDPGFEERSPNDTCPWLK